jgi:hypothetical protein
VKRGVRFKKRFLRRPAKIIRRRLLKPVRRLRRQAVRRLTARAFADERAKAERWLEAAKNEACEAGRERNALRRQLEALPRYEFGSYSSGVQSWGQRWRERPGRRVLLYARVDYAGSFFKWCAAINDFTEYAARLIVFEGHPYGYPVDLVFLPNADGDGSVAGPGLDELIDQAEIVHLKDETGFYLGSNGLPPDLFTRFGKPMVFTHYGGFARKHMDDPGYQDFVLGFDARIAMTPDLCFEWFDGSYIPHSVDTRRFAYSWRDGRLLGHSPSIPERKGTEDLLAAIDPLHVELDLIHGVPHEVCLERKALCNLFFDQAGRESPEHLGTDRAIGWYGNSALESAVHGIPTIAHLSEEAFDGAARGRRDIRGRCPIINTPLGVEGIRRTISEYFDLPLDERRDLSLRTRQWIEDFHSDEVVAARLAEVYDLARRRADRLDEPPHVLSAGLSE